MELMETVTFKLTRRQIERLKKRAVATGRSQGAVVRDLIDRHLERGQPSLHERASDLCGSISGRRDLSTRRMTGYGRD